MADLFVVRRTQRGALFLPMQQTQKNPGLIFPLVPVDRAQLDQQIRQQLEKQGITGEGEVQSIVDSAEKQYEQRVKVTEAKREIRRLMNIRRAGGKLMQVGFRKWRRVFYRPIKRRGE
mgnify:CR=1 FL=1